MKLEILFVSLLFAAVQGQGEVIRLLGEVPVSNPGFSNLFIDENFDTPAEKHHILMSSFDGSPVGDDDMFVFYQIGTQLDDIGSIEPLDISDSTLWPREPSQIPTDVFGYQAVSIPDGFLVPIKNQGDLNVIDVSDWSAPVTYGIARPPGDEVGWFYHRVIWKDMDGDGDRDALTSRTEVDLSSGGNTSQLVWFEHPNRADVFSETWVQHVIPQGTDRADTFSIEIALTVPSGETFDVVFTTGYWSHRLYAFWTTNPDGLWSNNEDIEAREVDVSFGRGRFLSIELADMNLDGRIDILASINDAENGSVWVYEIPDDFRTEEFTSHMVASGFFPQSGADEAGAPGAARPFHPITANEGTQKPFMVVSADDMGATYIYEPVDRLDPDNWEYSNITIVEEGAGFIVGQPTAFDTDGDGYSEIYVPSYTKDIMYIFSYTPEE